MPDRPYFLKNKEWYYFDEKNHCYVLTDKATEKARKSFKDYYSHSDVITNDNKAFNDLINKIFG